MNAVYRLVWRAGICAWVAVSELGKSHGHPAQGRRHIRAKRLLATSLLACGTQAAFAQVVTLGAYDPQINDNLVGAQIVAPGATMTLQGPQLFGAGDPGTRTTTLGALGAANRIVSGSQWIGAARLNPGTQNFGVTVPDPITGGSRVVSTYATANLVPAAPVDASTSVSDVVDVNGAQYINVRVGTVNSTGGTLDVNIGSSGAASTAATNGWTMAAKQSSLFYADGTGASPSAINWNSTNRITFTGVTAAPAQPQSLNVTFVAQYGGTFSVTTLDGATTTQTVTNDAQLRTYNNWLISQLQSGNMDPTQYTANFNKAYTSSTQSITYSITASNPADEIAQPIGLRVVMHAVGGLARDTVAIGGKLEVANSVGGAMRAEAGGAIVNNGTLATINGSGDGVAMLVTGASHGSNSGVINGNFFLNPNGTTVDGSFGSNIVDLSGGSNFDNSGIINLATGATNGAGASAGIRVGTQSLATSGGIINVGVTGSKSNGSMTGVLLNDPTASFTNLPVGLIYIGRGPQTSATAAPADVAVNQGTMTAGITVNGNATARNQGTITIGSKTQNAAAILVTGGPNATVNNTGTININGAAATVPRENDGILVINSGSGGGITDSGTINLNGVNGVGIKVLSTGGTASAATANGVINVAGGADPASGTRNFGVWAEGQGSATATASVGGTVNLLGNGAIGIHARGRSTVNVMAGAEPTFAGGSNQIAFFAFGPNALINVAATSLNVTTTGSTLFRVENGANFDGTGLSMTASGTNSLAVLGTGAPSVVNTHGAQIEVTGNNATGVVVEGGATGTIDAATTMHLTGVGSVAGIVDGQKHTLTGANSGSPVASTALTTAATLTESQQSLTGYIARNSGKLTNSGNISFSGAGSTGILVQTGATATNSGDIAITDGGTGILVDSTGATSATTGTTTGLVTVNGGSTSARTRGVVATGSRAVVNLSTGSRIQMNGDGAIGAEASNGGTVNVVATATPVFGAADQIAFHALGAGASVRSAASAIDASTANSTIYRIDDGATLALTGAAGLTASGNNARGITGSGVGTVVTTGSANFNVSGNGAQGIGIDGGASGTLSAGSSMSMGGPNATGGIVDGQKIDITGAAVGSPVSTTLTSNAAVNGSGTNATGFIARNMGTLVNNGAITMTGAGSTGVWLQSAGNLTNTSSIHVTNGTGVRVEGASPQTIQIGSVTVDDGLAGLRLLAGAQATINDSAGSIVTHGSANGILLDTGAVSLSAANTTITTDGTGNGIENAAEIAAVTLDNVTVNAGNGAGIRTATAFSPSSSVTINVAGSGTGLAFRHADGSAASGDLLLGTGYVVQANGAGATGIQALTTGAVNTQATVNVNSASGGSALVAGTASSTVNAGVLTSASTAAPVVDLSNGTGTTFTNTGTIQSSSPTAVAVMGSAGNDVLALTGGAVRGDIATGAGTDQFSWTAGTLNGSLTMGSGAGNSALVAGVDLGQTYHLTAGTGGGNALTLQNIVARGGSFAADDLGKGTNLGSGWNTINFSNGTNFTLTDNLQLANSDVVIDRTSTLRVGNGVNPVIFGASPGSARVTNAGVIDFTNGGSPGNQLTINGDYVSNAGVLRMGTDTNAGGALSNQFTDRLLVQGNVTTPGGPTILAITPSAASTGALTDLNQNRAVEANEGISVVQVAGTSTPDAFQLVNGYLGVGPWKYGLYSFAPGSSDATQRVVPGSGNTFWDYRLANVYACEADCEPTGRREVVPQVPSYISTPTALASYSYMVIDNLHKRLGEVRHESDLDEGQNGEVFARYIGGDYHYDTDRSFREFGYDYDLTTQAIQVGANVLSIDSDKSGMRGGVALTHGTTRIEPNAVDGYSRTKFYSNSIAAFLTWQDVNGFYVDGIVSGDRHQGDVDTAFNKDVARLRVSGWTASVETGYPWKFDNGMTLEPQLQLARIHQHVQDTTDLTDASVHYDDYNQNIGRLGVRLTRTWDSGDGMLRTPYVRLNYIQGWGGRPQVTVADAAIPDITANFTGGSYGRALELGLGGTWTFRNHISLYGEGDYQKALGSDGTRGWGINVGARWNF
ncbi:autotransporter family porin [Luteibacter sp. Sphag1AF]|uniref:autotransporter outer membrane beta-barrel domain-containing protein n=1 Tax=Luteibacter sp. Sphag1AF TaxID=2587031 RepID=UPI00161F83C9|nr:autotransporter outer membrane beta-barrel domain-containing protein [Luteibacter sp. Sphag1AF]MBB3228106.1 autotransporter family porin [Luteibacter sp. Sphag1AF]